MLMNCKQIEIPWKLYVQTQIIIFTLSLIKILEWYNCIDYAVCKYTVW